MEKEQQVAETTAGHVGDRLDVVYRQIAELALDPKNPRLHSRQQIRRSSQLEFSVRRLSAIMKACAWVLVRCARLIVGTSRHPSSWQARTRPWPAMTRR
jgi:hypothetical protein